MIFAYQYFPFSPICILIFINLETRRWGRKVVFLREGKGSERLSKFQLIHALFFY